MAEISIIKAVETIKNKEWLIPDFQREFVWDKDRITNLWDSVVRAYPMSSLLLWKLDIQKGNNLCNLYEFNEEQLLPNATTSTEYKPTQTIRAVLDGQQRLTSLLIGLRGSITEVKYRKQICQHLYLKISPINNGDIIDVNGNTLDPNIEPYSKKYDFNFLIDAETNLQDIYTDNSGMVWFRVGKIADLSDDNAWGNYLQNNNLGSYLGILNQLYNAVHSTYKIVYDERDNQADAITMFLRINCGVKPLSMADIIMSMITVHWAEAKNKVKNIVEEAKNKGFSIKSDFVIKCLLALFGKNVKYHPNNIDKAFVENISDRWSDVNNCFEVLFDLLYQSGLSNKKISNVALVPIYCYLFWNNKTNISLLNNTDKESIQKWLLKTIILKSFTSQTDTVITNAIRPFNKGTQNHTAFPANKISAEIGQKPLSKQEIEDLLNNLKYKDSDTYFVLSLLHLGHFCFTMPHDIDHLHPKDNIGKALTSDQCNSILNLHLLESSLNRANANGKGSLPLDAWICGMVPAKQSQIKRDSFIPTGESLDVKDFDAFCAARKKLMVSELLRKLK